jgi:hypothetical protein
MVNFEIKNSTLGKFWSVFQWKMLVNFKAIWSILLIFGLFYCYLVYFTAIWYIILLPSGIFCGNFGIFFPILVCCAKKNLATLLLSSVRSLSLFWHFTSRRFFRLDFFVINSENRFWNANVRFLGATNPVCRSFFLFLYLCKVNAQVHR